jgi:4-amino-4-deoxy-L-arabinose transferase-like glycosyltransferase
MLYTLMLSVGSIAGAKLWHWLCGALLVASVYTFAVRHAAETPERGRTIGLIAALVVASTPIVLWEASVAYVDLATALFTWLSVYALLNAAERVRAGDETGARAVDSVPWLMTSALLMGLALGTKLTVLGFWGMLFVAILGWHVATTGKWAKQTIPHALLWGGTSLALALPWFAKSWLYTGNPVYPFFYGIFGGRYWSVENAALYTKDQAAFGFGKMPLDLLLAPWQATVEAGLLPPNRPFVFTEYVVFGLSPVYVGLVLAAPLLVRRLSRTSVFLALFGLGVFGFWFFLMQQTRYLIPALPALAVVAAEVLLIIWDETRIARRLGAALVAASALWGLYLSAVLLAAPALPVVTGRETRQAYLDRRLPGLAPAIDFINRETPKDAKVALFDEVRGFYLDREYVWATPNHAAGLLPWDRYQNADDWLADFARRGYTTLLVNRRRNAPKPPDDQKWRRLLPEAVASDRVRLAFSDRRVDVYRIVEPRTP